MCWLTYNWKSSNLFFFWNEMVQFLCSCFISSIDNSEFYKQNYLWLLAYKPWVCHTTESKIPLLCYWSNDSSRVWEKKQVIIFEQYGNALMYGNLVMVIYKPGIISYTKVKAKWLCVINRIDIKDECLLFSHIIYYFVSLD